MEALSLVRHGCCVFEEVAVGELKKSGTSQDVGLSESNSKHFPKVNDNHQTNS